MSLVLFFQCMDRIQMCDFKIVTFRYLTKYIAGVKGCFIGNPKGDCTWRRVLGPFQSLLLRFFLNLLSLLLNPTWIKILNYDTINSFYVFLLTISEKQRLFTYLPLTNHKIDINIHERWTWHYQNGTGIRLACIIMPCIKKLCDHSFTMIVSILCGTRILYTMVQQ